MKVDTDFLLWTGWLLSALSFGISVGFGIWSVRTQRKSVQTTAGIVRSTENIVQKTQAIQNALTTRSIGVFPSFLRDIVQIVKTADERVVILCDFPAYGCVSD